MVDEGWSRAEWSRMSRFKDVKTYRDEHGNKYLIARSVATTLKEEAILRATRMTENARAFGQQSKPLPREWVERNRMYTYRDSVISGDETAESLLANLTYLYEKLESTALADLAFYRGHATMLVNSAPKQPMPIDIAFQYGAGINLYENKDYNLFKKGIDAFYANNGTSIASGRAFTSVWGQDAVQSAPMHLADFAEPVGFMTVFGRVDATQYHVFVLRGHLRLYDTGYDSSLIVQ